MSGVPNHFIVGSQPDDLQYRSLQTSYNDSQIYSQPFYPDEVYRCVSFNHEVAPTFNESENDIGYHCHRPSKDLSSHILHFAEKPSPNTFLQRLSEPPACPQMLQPCSHFRTTRCDLTYLCDSIKEICVEAGIDCVSLTGGSSFVFQCDGYVRSRAARFRISVFQASDSSGPSSCYVVEFQRISGDMRVYGACWTRVHSALIGRECIESDRSVTHNVPRADALLQSHMPLCAPFSPLPVLTAGCLKETLSILSNMANGDSECQSAKFEAIQMLAELSFTDQTCSALIEFHGIIEAIFACLSFDDVEIRRCAATALANIVSLRAESSLVVFLKTEYISIILRILHEAVSANSLQLIREVERTLLALLNKVSSRLSSTEQQQLSSMMNTECVLVSTLQCHNDRLIKNYGNAIETAIHSF